MIRIEYDPTVDPPAPSGPHGGPGDPHTVRSPSALYCVDCGEKLDAVLLARMRAALVREGEHVR